MRRRREQGELQNPCLAYCLPGCTVPAKNIKQINVSSWLMGRDQISSAIFSLQKFFNDYLYFPICIPLLCTEANASFTGLLMDDSLVSDTLIFSCTSSRSLWKESHPCCRHSTFRWPKHMHDFLILMHKFLYIHSCYSHTVTFHRKNKKAAKMVTA